MKNFLDHLLPNTSSLSLRGHTGIFFLVLVIGALMLTAMDIKESPETGIYAAQVETVRATETPVVVITPSPIPLELKKNEEQTNGIILGGILLVLIILGGTLSILRREQTTDQG